MATVQMNKNGKSWRSRSLGAIALILIAVTAWNWGAINSRVLADTSYAARVACSCQFGSGRDLSSCRDDLLPGMGLIILSSDKSEKSVTARFLPLASQTAHYREGKGCALESIAR